MAESASHPGNTPKTTTNKTRWFRMTLYALVVVAGYWIGRVRQGGAATTQNDPQVTGCARNSRASAFVESMLKTVNAPGDTIRMDVDLGDGRTLALCGRVFPEGAAPPADVPVSWPGGVSSGVNDVLGGEELGSSRTEMEMDP
jgi:hypothetical protein